MPVISLSQSNDDEAPLGDPKSHGYFAQGWVNMRTRKSNIIKNIIKRMLSFDDA